MNIDLNFTYSSIAIVAALPATAALADPGAEIAFLQQDPRTGKMWAYVTDPAGERTRMVGEQPAEGPPIWSPDGRWIAFEFQSEGLHGVQLWPMAGQPGVAPLLAGDAGRYWPAWSPDSSEVAVVTDLAGNGQVVVRELGSDREYIWAGGQRGFLRVVWLDDNVLIGVMERGAPAAAGSRTTDLVRVTPSEVEPVAALMTDTERYCEWSPAISPVNQTIAFESNDGGDREIFAVLTRRGVVDLSNHRDADWNPVWSPDGAWLAFESFRGGRRGIYRVNPGRVAVQPIAADAESDNWWPAWSPDATQIAFVSDRTGRAKLYVAFAAANPPWRARALFANTETEEFAPAWRPKAGG